MMKRITLMTLVPLAFTICAGLSFLAMAQENLKKEPTYKLRVARPTDNLKEVLKFYRDGLGLEVLTSFNHQGYEGQILGRKGSPYHLEFLHQRGRKFGKAPTQNNLLVFYLPEAEGKNAIERMQKHGYEPVKSYNPYWDERGRTFEDIDGYRLVLVPHSNLHFRVTRSTDNFKEVIKFYRDGLGLDVLMGGKHQEYEGAVLGRKGAQFELEFEHIQGETVGKAATHENLLVFFIPDKAEWKSAVERMKKHGYQPVKAENPWGNTDAKTFEDIDGYRVVLKNTDWNL